MAGIALSLASSHAAIVVSVGTTGVFDEGVNATNQLDSEVTAGTLAPFTSAVLNAYNNDFGGVIDWETGVAVTTSSGSSSNNTTTSVNASYGVSASSSLTVTFGRAMELYTNNIAGQVNVLSQQGALQNALIPQGVTADALGYTMTFSGIGVSEIGAAIPSRSTYSANGVTAVNFRATANFSSSAPSVLNFTVGGTAGTDDTFLHFAAPSGETIDSLSVTWISETGGTLANGQRRPILDDIGFIVIPEPSTTGLLGLAALLLAFGIRRR